MLGLEITVILLFVEHEFLRYHEVFSGKFYKVHTVGQSAHRVMCHIVLGVGIELVYNLTLCIVNANDKRRGCKLLAVSDV